MSSLVEPVSTTSAIAGFSFSTYVDERRRTIHSRRLMLALSRVIEDTAATLPGTTVIAAFQRFSFVAPQVARYTRLTPHLAGAYLLGMPDAQPPSWPNATLVPLDPSWPLIHEWVVIAIGPACCVGLFAQDPAASQPAQRTRQFTGCWTTDGEVLDAAWDGFFRALGQPRAPVQRDSRAVLATSQRLQQQLRAQVRAVR